MLHFSASPYCDRRQRWQEDKIKHFFRLLLELYFYIVFIKKYTNGYVQFYWQQNLRLKPIFHFILQTTNTSTFLLLKT